MRSTWRTRGGRRYPIQDRPLKRSLARGHPAPTRDTADNEGQVEVREWLGLEVDGEEEEEEEEDAAGTRHGMVARVA